MCSGIIEGHAPHREAQTLTIRTENVIWAYSNLDFKGVIPVPYFSETCPRGHKYMSLSSKTADRAGKREG